MNSFLNYLKEVKAEMLHVVWPTKRETLTHSILVILISVFTALALYVSDISLAKLLDKLINFF